METKITITPSKSHTMRAILLASLGTGRSAIRKFLESPDTNSMIDACRSFGAQIKKEKENLIIDGCMPNFTKNIDAGNSGQVLRFVLAIAALGGKEVVFSGDHSIKNNRVVEPLCSAICQLGGKVKFLERENFPPFAVQGPILPGVVQMDGEDSQPVSAMIMAASFLDGKTEIVVDNSGEKPWIDLTLDWLSRLGGNVENANYQKYIVNGPISYDGFEFTVPGDWSSAAFFIAAALIAGVEVALHNLDMKDIQGDKEIVEILQKMGAEIEKKADGLIVRRSSLKGISVDINSCIDALPVLAVLGCFAEGKTHIFNAAVARRKESDRISAIVSELKKMDADIEELEDGLIVKKSVLKSVSLRSHADHRIAMALKVADLGTCGGSEIEGADCVKKSNPEFFTQLSLITKANKL